MRKLLQFLAVNKYDTLNALFQINNGRGYIVIDGLLSPIEVFFKQQTDYTLWIMKL